MKDFRFSFESRLKGSNRQRSAVVCAAQRRDSKLSKYLIIYAHLLTNKGRECLFRDLKPSVSFNSDVCGVRLNHSNQPQKTKRSQFHDNKDVAVTFRRGELVTAYKNKCSTETYLHVWTLIFYCQLSTSFVNNR